MAVRLGVVTAAAIVALDARDPAHALAILDRVLEDSRPFIEATPWAFVGVPAGFRTGPQPTPAFTRLYAYAVARLHAFRERG